MADAKRILVDINILIDIIEKRANWQNSLAVVSGVDKKIFDGYVSALTIPILYFRRLKVSSDKKAREEVSQMIYGFKIIDLTDKILKDALNDNRFTDYEDAIQYHSANNNAEAIVTRNISDFSKVKKNIEILNPEDFLKKYKV